ncbi:hypothetical protein TDB9533_01843 [Thalassocella blandensis]|nr:hypothetical protein TDB9533_01843 [Thalassocella blandensis]
MNKLTQFSTIVLGSSLLAGNAFASSLEADIHADAIKAKYNFNSERASMGLSAAVLITDENGEAYSFDIRSQGLLNKTQDANIRGGFGIRGYHVAPDGDADSFQALSLGGFVDVGIPSIPDVTFGVDLYYAPSILVTDDIDSLYELNLRVSYQLFQNAKVYAGLRDFEVGFEDFDYDIDDNLHVGFKLDF